MKKTAFVFGFITLVAFTISQRSIRHVESARLTSTNERLENFDIRLAGPRAAGDRKYDNAIEGIQGSLAARLGQPNAIRFTTPVRYGRTCCGKLEDN